MMINSYRLFSMRKSEMCVNVCLVKHCWLHSLVYAPHLLHCANPGYPLPSLQVFIGLGFPYEGPAPLEAIAYGCVFINPQLNPPVNRDNSQHFAKKPTGRAVSLSLVHTYILCTVFGARYAVLPQPVSVELDVECCRMWYMFVVAQLTLFSCLPLL